MKAILFCVCLLNIWPIKYETDVLCHKVYFYWPYSQAEGIIFFQVLNRSGKANKSTHNHLISMIAGNLIFGSFPYPKEKWILSKKEKAIQMLFFAMPLRFESLFFNSIPSEMIRQTLILQLSSQTLIFVLSVELWKEFSGWKNAIYQITVNTMDLY